MPSIYAKIIETAMSFPMDDLLRKYRIEHSIPIETTREHEREIKRFLALSVINSSAKYVMSGPMDELWHSFIQFTKQDIIFIIFHQFQTTNQMTSEVICNFFGITRSYLAKNRLHNIGHDRKRNLRTVHQVVVSHTVWVA
jgi:hypothetical protein